MAIGKVRKRCMKAVVSPTRPSSLPFTTLSFLYTTWLVAEVLMLVRDEVLCRLSQQLPPEMQLIEAALAAPDGAERLALLKRHALLSTDQLSDPAASGSGSSEGGSSSSQGSSSGLDCLAADLERAVSQVIGDMELMLAVPDRCAGRCRVSLCW